MSLQDSTFNTTNVLDNEIIKANDFNFAFENLIENVSKSTQMLLESNQDFVINGKVLPYSGMNVQISPIYGVCKSTGIPFGRTETAVMEYGFESSTSGRIDIIQVKGEWETYDNQQRAFNDPETDTQTYQYVDTKKLMRPVYDIKKGLEGSGVAPTVDSGFVKLAEVVIRANASSILASDIKNITADIAGLDNDDWTTEKDNTYNIGYISDVNERFRVQHEADGTHSDNCINSDSLDIGTGTKQINGNILPIGGVVTVPTQSAISATDSILSVITKAINVITALYNNYLKFGNYGFEGEVQISSTDTDGVLNNPLKISADGSGNATIKIGNTTVLSIDSTGKLSTNGYTATSNNHIVTKAVTDAISTALNALTVRVSNIENTSDTTVYANNTLSAGTDGRYNMDNVSIYAATTENVTLSGTQIIDDTTPVNGVFILVKEQTDAKKNGIYQYSSNSVWSRVSSYVSPNSMKGKIFSVANGTANGKRMFYLAKVNFTDGLNFGSDDIIFSEYFGSIQPLANRIPMRDTNGCVKTNDSQTAKDCVNRGELNTYNSSMARAMLNWIYPVGSIYWTSKAPDNGGDPNTLFGGTWVQIKDRFIWAKGDNDTVNATNGSKTITLSISHLPAHVHGLNSHKHSLQDHTHSLNSHTHNMAHYHYFSKTSGTGGRVAFVSRGATGSNVEDTVVWPYDSTGTITMNGDSTTANRVTVGSNASAKRTILNFPAHTHSVSGYTNGSLYSNTSGTTITNTAGPSTANTTGPSTSNTGTPSTTDTTNNSSQLTNNSITIMPPYIVKYCWERTA